MTEIRRIGISNELMRSGIFNKNNKRNKVWRGTTPSTGGVVVVNGQTMISAKGQRLEREGALWTK
jgi:hypothetical protein